MKTLERTKFDFERQFQYQDLGYNPNDVRNFNRFENEQFIVPWQMEKTKKDKILIE